MANEPFAVLTITRPTVGPQIDDLLDPVDDSYRINHPGPCGNLDHEGCCAVCEDFVDTLQGPFQFNNWPQGLTGSWAVELDFDESWEHDWEFPYLTAVLTVTDPWRPPLVLVPACVPTGTAPTPPEIRGLYAKRSNYGGVRMRSHMEVTIAALLDLHGIEWSYEADHGYPNLPYRPDFRIGPGRRGMPLPGWIEVKPKNLILRVSEAMGLPRYVRGSKYDFDHATSGVVEIDPMTLPVEMRKPWALAIMDQTPVWVVGEPTANQAFIEFRANGTAVATRRCPLFQNVELYDRARAMTRNLPVQSDGSSTEP